MKYLKTVLATFALALAMLAPAAAPANADTPGCVSDGEFQNTDPGEKMSSVHERYDTEGIQTSVRFDDGGVYRIRRYLKCYQSDAYGSFVRVEYWQLIQGGETTGPTTVVRKWRSEL